LASKKSDTIAFIATTTPKAPDFVILEFLTGISMGVQNSNTEFIVKLTSREKDEINFYEQLIRTKQADKFIFYRTKKYDPRITMLKKK